MFISIYGNEFDTYVIAENDMMKRFCTNELIKSFDPCSKSHMSQGLITTSITHMIRTVISSLFHQSSLIPQSLHSKPTVNRHCLKGN